MAKEIGGEKGRNGEGGDRLGRRGSRRRKEYCIEYKEILFDIF